MTLWIGTYAAKGGRGLYRLGVGDGALTLGPPDDRIANASFAAWSPDGRTAYFVDEREDGCVSAWLHADGEWHPRGEASSGGALPCYLSVHPEGSWLAVANYGDGAVALARLDPASGELLGVADTRRQQGRGPNRDRQDGPHAHCALFDSAGEWLYHVDLGLDRVFRYPLRDGRLGDGEIAFAAPPGTGPRHLAWHPDGRHALLLCELSAELMLLEIRVDRLTMRDKVATSAARKPENLGGHLAIGQDGTVRVTNRGANTLAEFTIERDRLRRGRERPTGAASPRHFVELEGGFLLAHEKDGTVRLLPGGQGSVASVEVPGAAFVLAGGE